MIIRKTERFYVERKKKWLKHSNWDKETYSNLHVVSNSVVCKINMRPENCYYRDITMECKGCRNNANNYC